MAGLDPFIAIYTYAQTGTGAGLVIGNGRSVKFGNGAGVNRNQYPWVQGFRVILTDSTSGGSATFQVQDSDDNSSFTTRYTYTATIATGATMKSHRFVFKTSKRFCRINISAISGGSAPTAYAYATLGALANG